MLSFQANSARKLLSGWLSPPRTVTTMMPSWKKPKSSEPQLYCAHPPPTHHLWSSHANALLPPARSMFTGMPSRKPPKSIKNQPSVLPAAMISLQAGVRVWSRPEFYRTPSWKRKRPSEHRPPVSCSLAPYNYPVSRPCFDLTSVLVEQGNKCHEKIIRSFLFAHYWPREPSTVSMYMPLCSPYLSILTEKYATSGDRFLAFEIQPRTRERKPVGVLVANKTFPWVADEYEEWAHNCSLKPERNNMYFRAHCIRSPNVFDKYHIPYSYDIEVLATSSEVSAQGVALLLLRTAVMRAMEQRHPIIQMVSKSEYTHALCKRVGMKQDWSMNYSEFIDMAGQSVFYPRRPHLTVALYVRPFDQKAGSVVEACFEPELYEVYKKQVIDKKTIEHSKKTCDIGYPLFPKCQT